MSNEEAAMQKIAEIYTLYADQGFPLEGGWQALATTAVDQTKATEESLSEMRRIYFLGAMNLHSILFSACGQETMAKLIELWPFLPQIQNELDMMRAEVRARKGS